MSTLPLPAEPDLLLRTLSDPTRRSLFERLCRAGEQSVTALTAAGAVSQPAVSKHLALLKEAGLVQARPDGRQTHYSARPEALTPLMDWADSMTRAWEARFDRLDDLLNRMDQ